MLCIYHSEDFDGWASAAIVKLKFPEAKMHGWTYGQEVPWKKIDKADKVVLVDISFSPEDMLKLKTSGKEVVWIDHHRSSINNSVYHNYNNLEGLRKEGTAACKLTWSYFNLEKETPYIIELLHLYDVYDKSDSHRWKNEILPFQYGLRTRCVSYSQFNPDWVKEETSPGCNTEFIHRVIHDGDLIIKYRESQSDRLERYSFPVRFKRKNGGIVLLKAVVATNCNWQNFEDRIDIEAYSGLIVLRYTGKKWTCSAYGDERSNFDTIEIANAFPNRGGGHPKACGFQPTQEEVLHIINNREIKKLED